MIKNNVKNKDDHRILPTPLTPKSKINLKFKKQDRIVINCIKNPSIKNTLEKHKLFLLNECKDL